MINFLNLLNKHWSNKILIRAMFIIALIGIADTIYLTSDHYLGTGIQCLLVEGCDIVLASQYSSILGIPLALIGLIFYAGMFVLINLFDIYENKYTTMMLLAGGIVGFASSLVFLYLQIFVIKVLCIYCLTSLASSTVLFVLATILFRRRAGTIVYNGGIIE